MARGLVCPYGTSSFLIHPKSDYCTYEVVFGDMPELF